MSDDDALANAALRAASGAGRLARAWRALSPERRMAAYAAVGLFLALFLPWYQETVIASGRATKLQAASASITGWGAFSFVEACMVVVSAAVLILLFRRAEGRSFKLPGGDGSAIAAAGLFTSLLIVWRIFDKQGTSVRGPGATTTGIEWGIIAALIIAAVLTYSGSRIRMADAIARIDSVTPRTPRTSRRRTPARAPAPQPARPRPTEPARPRPAEPARPRPTADDDEQLTIPFEQSSADH